VVPIDFEDLFLLGFYVIATIMQLYFLWNISESLRSIINRK